MPERFTERASRTRFAAHTALGQGRGVRELTLRSDRAVSDGAAFDGAVSDGPVSDGAVSDGPRQAAWSAVGVALGEAWGRW